MANNMQKNLLGPRNSGDTSKNSFPNHCDHENEIDSYVNSNIHRLIEAVKNSCPTNVNLIEYLQNLEMNNISNNEYRMKSAISEIICDLFDASSESAEGNADSEKDHLAWVIEVIDVINSSKKHQGITQPVCICDILSEIEDEAPRLHRYDAKKAKALSDITEKQWQDQIKYTEYKIFEMATFMLVVGIVSFICLFMLMIYPVAMVTLKSAETVLAIQTGTLTSMHVIQLIHQVFNMLMMYSICHLLQSFSFLSKFCLIFGLFLTMITMDQYFTKTCAMIFNRYFTRLDDFMINYQDTEKDIITSYMQRFSTKDIEVNNMANEEIELKPPETTQSDPIVSTPEKDNSSSPSIFDDDDYVFAEESDAPTHKNS